MTDKEKANRFREDLVCSTTRYVGQENYGYIEQAYLAGAEENGVVWHDLREDPNDLPPRLGLGSEEVYVQYDIKGVTDFACYRFDKNIWERSEDDEQAVGVIAWCKIPQFKE